MENITLEKALELTFEKLGELKNQGIKVVLIPTKSRFNPETVKKYNRTGRLSPAYWFHANLKCEDKEQSDLVFKAAWELSQKGICFDTGGMCGSRDWELDWSFHVALDHMSMTEGRKVVEEVLTTMCETGEEPEL